MAEGSKDPCISLVDASHGEWPRIESFLLFVTFFILSKSLRKAYFLRVKLGSLERKLPRLGIDIFLNFLTLKTFQSNKPLKKARPFSSLVILMRVEKPVWKLADRYKSAQSTGEIFLTPPLSLFRLDG
jgi:hypothetical protein